MSYKWKPNKAQRKAFAEKMQNPTERLAYDRRKEEKAAKKKEGSKYDYNTAGGNYKPTKAQYEYAMNRPTNLTTEQDNACNMVEVAFIQNDVCQHDHIHVINELIRKL